MQSEGDLLDEILALYRSAGREAASYARLERSIARTEGVLRAYLRDVARDYIVRLEKRLQRPGARLTPEEVDLVWAWEGLRPQDARREHLLLDDLGALATVIEDVTALKGRRLGPAQIDRLRRAVEDGALILPRIVRALEEQEEARKLQAELGDGGATLAREALLARLRRGLAADG